MSKELFDYDEKIRKQRKIKILCGVDETGRGPWAGPIVAAAVILKPDIVIQGLNDSKKLNEKTRIAIEKDIKENALSWGISEISAQEIDKKGLTYANTQVMINAAKIAAEKINLNLDEIDLYIIDQSPCSSLRPQIMMPKADSTSACVAAASVLAKNYRDSIIKEIGNKHPEYLFDDHKGYINKVHVDMVKKYGLIDGVHRKSYVVSGYNKPKQINLMDIFDENDEC
jgi:ribonuclease HII